MTKLYDILLDSDVVRHYLKGGQILLLPKLYQNRLVMLDVVQTELCRSKELKTQIEGFIQYSKIKQVSFPSDGHIVTEYARLRQASFGEGESACMAYARHNPHIIASSNLKDIKLYCERNGIQYLTTMDILHEAYTKGELDEGQCDYFIHEVLRQKSILPCTNMKDFITRFKKT
ncbi:MAG: hypothetical protein ACOYXT_00220 [Bacteroidota bacterium]